MINEYDKGGLKMIDIHSFNASLKIKWFEHWQWGKMEECIWLLSEKARREIALPRQPKKQDIPLLDIREPFWEKPPSNEPI